MIHDKTFTAFTQSVPCAPGGGGSLNWLVVMPKITQFDDQKYNFPIGIAYISSALKATGRTVFTLNMNYKKETVLARLSELMTRHAIGVVATGGITVQYALLKEIFDAAKQINPRVITVCGGGIITSDPEPAMTALENADYGVIGEGERTVCALAYALETGADAGTVKGLVYREAGGAYTVTAPREEIDDLDSIPWPDYDGFEYAEMLSKTPTDVMTAVNVNERIGIVFYSRSCPYNCTFCFHSSGKRYRTRTLDGFFEEFEYLMGRYTFDSFFLADEFFIKNLDFVRAFCDRIKPYGIRWSCSGRVDNISKEMLRLLSDAGCYRIGFGVESANDRILKSMRKAITRSQIENAFTLCQEAGMEAQGNLIFGDLEETVETAMDTLNWWKAHQDWAITLHWIIAYPGSHVYRTARQRGIIPDPVAFIKSGCPEVNFSKMTDDERRRVASVMDMLVSDRHDRLGRATLSQGQSGKVTAEGDCPYCGQRGTYFNLDPLRPIKLDICPACGRTLRLYASDYADAARFDDNLRQYLSQSRKVAFWPVIIGMAQLVARIPAMQEPDVYLIDSSPYKQGMELHGKTIEPPDAIRENGIDTVFITTTTSVGSDIASRIQKDFPAVKRVEAIGNLFFAAKE